MQLLRLNELNMGCRQAGRGLGHLFKGPESACSISMEVAKQAVRDWTNISMEVAKEAVRDWTNKQRPQETL
jgi:hypothetical protein